MDTEVESAQFDGRVKTNGVPRNTYATAFRKPRTGAGLPHPESTLGDWVRLDKDGRQRGIGNACWPLTDLEIEPGSHQKGIG